MQIGDVIKLMRTARKMRQRQLASELNVSPNYLSMLEANKREPSLSLLKRIAHVLAVPAGLLVIWSDSQATSLKKSQKNKLRELLIQIQLIYMQDRAGKQKRRRAEHFVNP